MSKTFETWWEESGQRWAAACVERGGVLWTDDAHERRELFERRHQRPEPPHGMAPIKSIRSYQKRYTDDTHHRRDQLTVEQAA